MNLIFHFEKNEEKLKTHTGNQNYFDHKLNTTWKHQEKFIDRQKACAVPHSKK
jgi:hypothetical protein